MLCQLSFHLFLLASPPIPRPNNAYRNYLMIQDNARLFRSAMNHLHGLGQFATVLQTLQREPACDCILSWKEMLGVIMLQVRALLAWLWLHLWTQATVLIWEMCGSNLLQGFILSSAGQAHMSCRSMFFSSGGADLPLCTATACARAPHCSGLLDWLIYPPLSNLANDFSLQILLLSLERRHTASSHVNHIPKLWCHLYFPLLRLLRNPSQDDCFHLLSSLGDTRAGLLCWTL